MHGLDAFAFGDLSRINEKKVTLNVNGVFENGKVMYIKDEWDLRAFLREAGPRLGLDRAGADRCFNSDGVEVTDMVMVDDGEHLFLAAAGDEFLAPGFTGEESGDYRDEGGGGGGGDRESSSSSSSVPKTVGGYKVREFLGRGGFGEVRVGEHQLSGRRVALKFVKQDGLRDLGAVERATTEVQCLLALKHPHIITLLQHIVTPRYVVMAFELMAGGDLYEHLAGLPVSALPEDEARAIFQQVLGAIAHAHNNHICHRDLKLENILIVDKEPADGRIQVKIADFGLSDFYRPGAHVRTNCGSLSYLAPEVFRGTSNAGPPLDVWSAGVVLFALLCGRLPFEGTDLRGGGGGGAAGAAPDAAAIRRRVVNCQYKVDESLSPEARDLIRRLLKLDPSERASVPEVFGHCWLRARGLSAADVPSFSDRGSSPARRRPPAPSRAKAAAAAAPPPSSAAGGGGSGKEEEVEGEAPAVPLRAAGAPPGPAAAAAAAVRPARRGLGRGGASSSSDSEEGPPSSERAPSPGSGGNGPRRTSSGRRARPRRVGSRGEGPSGGGGGGGGEGHPSEARLQRDRRRQARERGRGGGGGNGGGGGGGGGAGGGEELPLGPPDAAVVAGGGPAKPKRVSTVGRESKVQWEERLSKHLNESKLDDSFRSVQSPGADHLGATSRSGSQRTRDTITRGGRRRRVESGEEEKIAVAATNSLEESIASSNNTATTDINSHLPRWSSSNKSSSGRRRRVDSSGAKSEDIAQQTSIRSGLNSPTIDGSSVPTNFI